ncbi:hypothetical protein ACQR06_02635 [Bradyrhizobium sp. HKCCYLRH1065]|uniref:hypothetical protein n=1 Tax=Bradyrhizobium sp. HKCCYLRH1065 TaxID=3420753 RepID=UPI003EBA1527
MPIEPSAPQLLRHTVRSNAATGVGGGHICQSLGGNASSVTEAGATDVAPASSRLQQHDFKASGKGTVERLDPQTLGALTGLLTSSDVTPSPEPPTGPAASDALTRHGSDAPPSRVPIDSVHVELPNGVKFDFHYSPTAGTDPNDALSYLMKAVEMLSKALEGMTIPSASGGASDTQNGDTAASTYLKQLPVAGRSTDESTNKTA